MKVIAVIPAYHEGKRIGTTVEQIRPHVDGVIVVDDGSSDNTFSEARATGVVVLRHAVNGGQGLALRTGTEAARRLGAEIILHIDADGQHDPSDIEKMVQPIERGEADVVFGSRFLGTTSGMPFSRRVLLRGATSFNALLMGIPRRVTDPQSGLRAFRSMVDLTWSQNGMAHCSEILRQVTRHPSWRWKEVPIHVRYTEASLAKGQSAFNAFHIAWKLFISTFQS